MPRLYDHIDLRVPSLADAAPFYEALLPALGFSRRVDLDGWIQFQAEDDAISAFFGVTESPEHSPNENRIAFRAEDREEVDRIARIAKGVGARNVEGPEDYVEGYYAVFFEDPCGNRFEVCHRRAGVT